MNKRCGDVARNTQLEHPTNYTEIYWYQQGRKRQYTRYTLYLIQYIFLIISPVSTHEPKIY